MDGYGADISHAARGMQNPELKSFKWARGARQWPFSGHKTWTDVCVPLHDTVRQWAQQQHLYLRSLCGGIRVRMPQIFGRQ